MFSYFLSDETDDWSTMGDIDSDTFKLEDTANQDNEDEEGQIFQDDDFHTRQIMNSSPIFSISLPFEEQ